ncbi:MAG: response regulator transcription factor [Acidobacteria bacterium]|nr:response regulator transcription factor [Acidobacteriota bacterium]
METLGRILVVEDEGHLADGLRFNLEAEGYDVDCVETGETALERLAPGSAPDAYNAVILDIMLPGIDGFEVARRLRANACYVPILMLTARGRSQDMVEGFAAGADDYLPKPFELAILFARLSSLLRRARVWRAGQAAPASPLPVATSVAPEVFEFNGRRIDFGNLELAWQGTTLRLTLMEAQLLRHLLLRRGNVVSRKEILEQVWGVHEDTDTRAIDNFIVRLRRQIEDEPSQPKHLLTVRGVGYRFDP